MDDTFWVICIKESSILWGSTNYPPLGSLFLARYTKEQVSRHEREDYIDICDNGNWNGGWFSQRFIFLSEEEYELLKLLYT